MKKLLTIGVVGLFCISFSACSLEGCLSHNGEKDYNHIDCEEYIYYISKNAKDNDYYLVGNHFYDYGENMPAVWHINPYYNENEVKYYGINFDMGWQGVEQWTPSLWGMKEISMPYCMEMYDFWSDEYTVRHEREWPEKFTIVNHQEDGKWFIYHEEDDYQKDEYVRSLYYSSIVYEKRKNTYRSFLKEELPNGESHFIDVRKDGYVEYNFKICKANTAYMFNYENCPNDGYFFINDFEYGATIENAPYEPIRNGYTFGGWYKESECINAWDFETDTLPQAQYDEAGREIYQETKLYAKWIKE
ncbi:MAG: InlB B-repeat-containing protein [Clostridia bacterium]|nr:InlB B-repeat-containing protein [Clostridia bacterium]